MKGDAVRPACLFKIAVRHLSAEGSPDELRVCSRKLCALFLGFSAGRDMNSGEGGLRQELVAVEAELPAPRL